MTNLFSIGEVANIMNISTKTLRNYDHIGLLKPSYIDPSTNYRYYEYNQLFHIDLIRYLNKVLFFPLNDIKSIMEREENNSKQDLIKNLENHKKNLDNLISKYQYSKRVIDTMINDINIKQNSSFSNDIFEQYLLQRTLYYKEINTPIHDIDKFVNRHLMSYHNLENRETNTMCLFCSLSHFENNNEILIRGFGVISDKPIRDLKTLILPEGRYLTHSFLYSEENSINALAKLKNYLNDNKLRTNDNIILFSQIADLTAKSKYEYKMNFQILRYL